MDDGCCREQFAGITSACVAFSGGVDSSLLLGPRRSPRPRARRGLHRHLGDLPRRGARGGRQPRRRELGVAHVVAETDEFDDPSFVGNSRDRCYHCKRHLVERMAAVAAGARLRRAPGRRQPGRPGRPPSGHAGRRRGRRAAPVAGGRPRQGRRARPGAERRPRRPGTRRNRRAWRRACPTASRSRPRSWRPWPPGSGRCARLGFRQCRVRHHGQVARVEVEGDEIGRGGRAGARARSRAACMTPGSPTWRSTSMVSDREA